MQSVQQTLDSAFRKFGHGEQISTVSSLGLLKISGGSTIQFIVEVPATGTYEVMVRYQLCRRKTFTTQHMELGCYIICKYL